MTKKTKTDKKTAPAYSRGHGMRRRLDELADELRSIGYHATTWLKTENDAMETVKVVRGSPLARVYLKMDGDDVGYVQLALDGAASAASVAPDHRDDVAKVLR